MFPRLSRTYLKPLLRMIKKQTVTDDIRDSLQKMIKYALQRDYILCNEAYMEMAIGNAPWPIGTHKICRCFESTV